MKYYIGVTMLTATLLLCYRVSFGAEDIEGSPTTVQSQDNTDPRDDPAFKKEMAEAMFLVCIFVVTGFFLFVLMLTIARTTRRHRRRYKIGQKDDKTEYIDAWSRYRLNDKENEG